MIFTRDIIIVIDPTSTGGKVLIIFTHGVQTSSGYTGAGGSPYLQGLFKSYSNMKPLFSTFKEVLAALSTRALIVFPEL